MTNNKNLNLLSHLNIIDFPQNYLKNKSYIFIAYINYLTI